MAMELVTGKAGVPHISSEDIGAYQAAVSGTGVIQLQNYNGTFPEVTLQNANKVVVPPMMLLLDGRFVRITAAETVTIQSGSSGYKRRDLICVRYSRDSNSGVESVTLTAVRGTSTSGTPSTPSVSGSIIRGSSVATCPIASVDIDGITPSQPVMLTRQLPPAGDSLPYLVTTGWKPLTVSSGWGGVLGHTPQYRQLAGIVVVTGAVERRSGGYLSSLVTMPDKALRPAGTQFIGSSATSRGQASELYMSGAGVVGVQGYTAIDDDPGMIVPLSCVYVPVG